jgi:hypothetical protein
MSARSIALGLALLLAGLVALIVTGSINDVVIVPLLFLWWAARLLYESLPQALLWAVLVLIAVLLVAKSLAWHSAPLPAADPGLPTAGRVSDWARILRGSMRDEHGRWQLAQRLSQLTVEALAFREQRPVHEVSRAIDDGSLDIDPQLRAYLRAGSLPYAPMPRYRRRFGRPRQDTPHADPLAVDPQLAIDYLEKTGQHTNGEMY